MPVGRHTLHSSHPGLTTQYEYGGDETRNRAASLSTFELNKAGSYRTVPVTFVICTALGQSPKADQGTG
eukprot:scaffold176861_cov31-Prasinocladus_malaysianus.AAC.1